MISYGLQVIGTLDVLALFLLLLCVDWSTSSARNPRSSDLGRNGGKCLGVPNSKHGCRK